MERIMRVSFESSEMGGGAMSRRTLEDRVAALEQVVADLSAAVANLPKKSDWRDTVGLFTGDKFMEQVFEEALKYREADRRRTRQRYAKSRKRPAKA